MNIEGFTFQKEGFNLYDYIPELNVKTNQNEKKNEKQNQKQNQNESQKSKAYNEIRTNDKRITEENIDNTKNVVVYRFQDMSQNILLYNQERNRMANDTNLDFSGNTLLFLPDKTDPIKTTEDLMKHDVNTLLLQQNYIYIIGSITCATLLIGALIIGK
jgi:hypothetical protein